MFAARRTITMGNDVPAGCASSNCVPDSLRWQAAEWAQRLHREPMGDAIGVESVPTWQSDDGAPLVDGRQAHAAIRTSEMPGLHFPLLPRTRHPLLRALLAVIPLRRMERPSQEQQHNTDGDESKHPRTKKKPEQAKRTREKEIHATTPNEPEDARCANADSELATGGAKRSAPRRQRCGCWRKGSHLACRREELRC